MKTNREVNRDLIIIVLIGILLGFLIAFMDRDKSPDIEPSMIPPPPDNTGGWYYDFDEEEWMNLYRGNPRAKGVERTHKPYLDKDEIQEYLEDHIDGYLESTYWGEEYDLDDELEDEIK